MAYLTTRTNKKGQPIIYICFVDPETGKERRLSLKTTDHEAAEDILDDYNAADRLDLLRIPSYREKYVPTMAELFDHYLPYWKKNRAPRTYRDAESHIRLR